MGDAPDELVGFAYGEHLDGMPPRSLGYRLLAPARREPWCAEVEALARRLQAAPYSDHWPAVDLFCSVLLSDGRRLIAVARYGLADHTSSQRRGGLELIGVLAPADVGLHAALAVYRWLGRRRSTTDDLHQLGGGLSLKDILAAVPPEPLATDPMPVLPIRLWQEGALLFAAATPSEPDHRLRLLEQATGADWQWLPLVGPDFPLQQFAVRGPLVAWTPHLAGVALKVQSRTDDVAVVRPTRAKQRGRWAVWALAALLAAVAVGEVYSTIMLHHRLGELASAAPKAAMDETARSTPSKEDGRERFAAALHDLLKEQGVKDWDETRLLARYERAAAIHKELRLESGNREGKKAVGAVSLLAERSGARIDVLVRQALVGKGFSDKVIEAAVAEVRETLAADAAERR
jgi:hypothetical protein